MPDLTGRPFALEVERLIASSPVVLYRAWTTGLDLWFAAPGSVTMEPRVNAPFFFETEFKPEGAPTAQRHPHYGRFLRLVDNELIEHTWVTGAGGTDGAETIVTVELKLQGGCTRLELEHRGFATEAARDRHREAWPAVLAQLDRRIGSAAPDGELGRAASGK
ncbi:MAG TPA: SRPBCC domain-containing protein [Steroidobacteraceae bacterium]|nr:SRPBCC domain-containing protein [Steroidobacteraceae bacterium]